MCRCRVQSAIMDTTWLQAKHLGAKLLLAIFVVAGSAAAYGAATFFLRMWQSVKDAL